MKYFTPDLYIHLQDFRDEAMDAADAEWEEARARYLRRLKRIEPELPGTVRHLLRNFYLHDAAVLSMGQQDHTFVIVLRLDVPPNELLVLNYELTAEPIIHTAALPPEHRSSPVAWLYDEVDLIRGKKSHCTHSILFSNGWEVQLRLREVRVVQAQALFPVPGTALVPVSAAGVPQTA